MDNPPAFSLKRSEERVSRKRPSSSKPSHTTVVRARRKAACEAQWALKRHQIETHLEAGNSHISNLVYKQLQRTAGKSGQSLLPACFVVTGPTSSTYNTITAQIRKRLQLNGDSALFISLKASRCSNLKSLLTCVLQDAAAYGSGSANTAQADALVVRAATGLSYDLAGLYGQVVHAGIEKVVVSFDDSEGFDAALLYEAIELFHLWLNRIPFVLLFGIQTSIDSFHERLPLAAIRLLEGQQFNAVQSDGLTNELVHDCIITNAEGITLGPAVLESFLDNSSQQIQAFDDFLNAYKYSHAAHFHANAVSIFASPEVQFKEVSPATCYALRNLPSFRTMIENYEDHGLEKALVVSILQSDRALFDFTKSQLQTARKRVAQISVMTKVLSILQTVSQIADSVQGPLIYTQMMSGDFLDGEVYQDIILSLSKASSDQLSNVLEQIKATDEGAIDKKDILMFLKRLDALQKKNNSQIVFRSKHDVRKTTVRATVVAQKVELSRKTAQLSAADAAYSELLDDFVAWIQGFFQDNTFGLHRIYPKEVFVFEFAELLSTTFAPEVRHSIEEALYSTRGYFRTIDPSGSVNGSAAAHSNAITNPMHTALLYQMLLESGPLVNVGDWWAAFNSLLEGSDIEPPLSKALFQRSVAELQYLGAVRPSRRRTDHVARVLWNGL